MFTRAGQLHHCAVVLYVGEGPRGSRAACSALCWFQSLPPLPTSKLGPSGADSPGGWVCVCSRPLWVSPMNSPVRLGVSPTAASTPTGVFGHRFEALFPHWDPGLWVCLAPQLFLPVYPHTNVGPPAPPATVFPQVLSGWLLSLPSYRSG